MVLLADYGSRHKEMDFITGLPASEGYDAIFAVVDKLFKRPKHAPTYTTADAKDTTNIFFEAVVRHPGVPKVIISDRDLKFLSDFWRSLTLLMGVKLSRTTVHRAQADGHIGSGVLPQQPEARVSVTAALEWPAITVNLPLVE
ncbi:Reverse transcriptase-rnase h-integrase [Phytophthora megakarya]|uniref:Reverse transcriptase-rnase h-integrase n=1 Tax=Phytophthora megakarya TaxID=4795 RepID=A0A225W0S4_9STRA|nr:Reverse transcriptase-rnase h-integrase [Phytophthora megakarya]